MTNRANPTAIGAFVLGAILLSIGGIITFSKSKYFEEETTFVAYFESSVAGLDVGAPIQVKGVQVGTVAAIRGVIDPDSLDIKVPVVLTIERYALEATHAPSTQGIETDTIVVESVKVLIGRGLRAQLQSQSFVTGKLFVDLVFEPDSPTRYLGHPDYPEIPTIQGDLALLTENLEDLDFKLLVDSATQAIQSIDRLVSDPELPALVRNINALVVELHTQAKPLTASSLELLEELNGMVKELRNEVAPISSSTKELLDDMGELVAKADGEIGTVSSEARGLLSNMNEDRSQLVGELDRLIDRFNTIEGDYSMIQNTAHLIAEMRSTVRTIRSLADYLERHPEALIQGKD